MRRITHKLVGLEDERKSRFHSRRGELVTLRQLRSLPLAITLRSLNRSLQVPWLAPASVSALDKALNASDVLVELGGGASTPWLARRVGEMYTVEPNGEWSARIKASTYDLTNLTILNMPVRAAIVQLPRAPTVALVDHNPDALDFTRVQAVEEIVTSFNKTLRLLIVDDSDRPDLRILEPYLWERGYVGVRFRGFRPRPLQLTETTIYQRSA